MGERHDEALEELLAVAGEINSLADQQSYGFFHGGDPRDFSPDPECCTAVEIENHRLACVAWDVGRKDAPPMPQCTSGSGRVGGFGLGTNHAVDDDMIDWADRILRAHARLSEDA